MRDQIVIQQQQPSERAYHRDRETYFRDEEKDFSRGVDYLPKRRHVSSESGLVHASPKNVSDLKRQDHRIQNTHYTPSVDYGYKRHEYYPLDPSHETYRSGETSGYGNEASVQGRDFENWLHGGK